jgi:SulP family sulfate permease
MKINNLKGNIFGGITAGIVALPLALGFGVQSGLGASAGLYGAMALGLLASIFGGTNTQISGPTGPMTVISATTISIAIANYGSIDSALGVILLTFLLAGIFQIVFGVFKIGKYVKFIPYPVLSGFMSGIGVIIIIFQIFPMMGLGSPTKIIDVFTELPNGVKKLNPFAIYLTLGTVAVIYLFPKITKAVPSTLIGLVVVTLVSYLLKLDVPLIGNMPQGLPKLQISAITSIGVNELNMALLPAITLAGIGAIDSLLTSVVADNFTQTKHKSNKELIGQGIGNIAASLFGGIPGAGATMRTVVNIKSGGTSKLSGIIHSILLLLILLGLGAYVAYIPLSVLAGILITVGIGIIDRRGLKNILKVGRSDAFILIVVLLLTVFVDLLQAVGIGMVIASFIFMKKASDSVEINTELEKVDIFDREIPWSDEDLLSKNKWENVYIHRFDGPLFFGVASKMLERVTQIPKNAEVIIFRMSRVPFMDQSGLYALGDVIKKMKQMGITVVITMPQTQPKVLLRQNKFIPNIIPHEFVFQNIDDCAHWLKKYEKTYLK